MLRGLIKTGTAWALHGLQSDALFRVAGGASRLPVVIGYHRVVDKYPSDPKRSIPAMCISTRMLERQLDWIGRRYRFVTLDELGARLQWGERFKERVAAVTFDDGYQDVYENAFPLLKKKGIPAAVFVVTGMIGTNRPQLHDLIYLLLVRAFSDWGSPPRVIARFLAHKGISLPASPRARIAGRDPLTALETLLDLLPHDAVARLAETLAAEIRLPREIWDEHRPLHWDAVQAMHRAGFTICSHTRSHALLTAENCQRVGEELRDSRKELERRLGARVKHFAYPCGRFNSASVRAVAEAGYKFAYTICRHRDSTYPLLTVPRKILWEKSCMDVLADFSPAMMNCHVNWSFDRVAGCRQDHRAAAAVAGAGGLPKLRAA